MNAFALKRAHDLPLSCRIWRIKTGEYACAIVFAQSRRPYGEELVFAAGVKQVKAHLLKLYPTMKFETGRKRKPGKRKKPQ